MNKVQSEHTKVVDYSSNRIHELFGIKEFTEYSGEECVAIVDTETTAERGDNFGKPLIYDIGVTFVIKSTGLPVGKACYIIKETYCNAELMRGAFFTNRTFTDYPEILASGIGKLTTFNKAIAELTELFLDFNVSTFAAYNSAFDTRAFDKTADYINRVTVTGVDTDFGIVSDIRYGNLEVLDLWAASCMSFMASDDYKEQATVNHWLTKTGNFATNAEAANNFINHTLVGEDHTALSDTAIEAGIYRHILSLPDGLQAINNSYNKCGKTWRYVNDMGKSSALQWAQKNGFTPNA